MVIEEWKKSGIATKFPTYRQDKLITTESWLLGKRLDDEAENLWRINDVLYDFTDFIDRHPGGSFWLRETRGTDITEAFEAHHISLGPEKMLEKFRVREASKPRIITLTLKEDGFYKTLKSRVRDKLPSLDHRKKRVSDLIHLSLLVATFLFTVASGRGGNSLLFGLMAGGALCWTTITAHNYFHRRDNWQMYTFNLSLLNFAGWRISHAMSHHMFPNSFLDLELSMFEPLLCWVPNPYIKSRPMRVVSWLTEPLAWLIAFKLQMLTRIFYSLKIANIMFWHDLLPLSIPLALCLTSGWPLWMCVRQWLFIVTTASGLFCLIALNAAHHHPAIYHDGDANRDDRDWGLFQVDTIIDRSDLKGSQLLTLTHFGDHAMHHLFPTLDQGLLHQLYPVLYETLAEFKGELRECSYLHHILGQHKQLMRVQANPKPPGSGK